LSEIIDDPKKGSMKRKSTKPWYQPHYR
jgi:hypothetical protein